MAAGMIIPLELPMHRIAIFMAAPKKTRYYFAP
jgi:hypothetical protein